MVNGRADIKAFLDVPMRGEISNCQLLQADKIHPSAFAMPEGLNCACYQLSEHLGMDYFKTWDASRKIHNARYEDDFDEVAYVTPSVLIEWCVAQSYSVYFLRNSQLLYEKTTPIHNKGVAFQEHDGHCYLYTTVAPFTGMQVQAPKLLPNQVLPCSKRESSIPWVLWAPFGGVRRPGFLLTEDLASAREQIPLVPKISMSHKCEPRQLTYFYPKGKLVIMKEADNSSEIDCS